jgi:hypothetical protein|tara:strand:- start:173 stop:493 length:321 start_codon:yes stop_codon:yes gene_type:complete
MLVVGVGSALGLLLLALKIGGRKTIGMDILFDVLITGVLILSFMGTFSGMAAAMLGGLVVTVILFVMKKTMVHERLIVQKNAITVYKKVLNVPGIKWKEVQPDWKK